MIGEYTSRDVKDASKKVTHWFSQIDRGIRKRKKQEDRWELNEAFDDMRQWTDERNNYVAGQGDQVTVNKIGSFNRTYRAAIAFKNPTYKFKPRNAAGWEMINLPVMGSDGKPVTDPETGEAEVIQMTRAQARQELINDIVSRPHFGFRDTISRLVKAGCLGYGAVMVGYMPTFSTPLEKDTDDNVPVNEDGSFNWDGFLTDKITGMPMEDENGNPIKKNRLPVWEEWFIDWVHYRHMIIDPDGGNDFMKHRWVGMEQVRTLEEIKADPLLKNTKDLQSTGSLLKREDDDTEIDNFDDAGDDDDSTKLVRLFYIFDFIKDRRMVLADGHPKALLDEEMPLGITHSPFAFFRPNERITSTEEFYPRPLNTDQIPLVSENNTARQHLAQARSRAVRKILAEKGVLDPTNQGKLTDNVDLQYIEVDRISSYGLDKTLHMLTPPPIGGDLYNQLNIIGQDFDEVSGMGSASRGKSTGDTATETNKLSQYEGTRYDFDRMQLKDCLVLIGKKLDDSIDANMTVPRAIQISGTAGQLHEVLIDADTIACDGDIDIDLAEMTPTDDGAMASRMINFAQMIGQNPWMATNEAVVRTMAERVNITDNNFIKGLVESAQQKQQQEQQMLQMQIDAQMAQAQMSAQAGMAQAQMKAQAAGPGKDGKKPSSSAPANSAQEASQSAAGQQTMRMQGAK